MLLNLPPTRNTYGVKIGLNLSGIVLYVYDDEPRLDYRHINAISTAALAWRWERAIGLAFARMTTGYWGYEPIRSRTLFEWRIAA